MSAPALRGRYELVESDDLRPVRRARDTLLERDVLVWEVDAADLPRVRTAAAVRHPAFAAVHDVFAEDGRGWVVTEPVEGRPLARTGTLPQSEAAALALDLLVALSAVHALGVVHGAVSPTTVLRAPDGSTRIIGFGLPPEEPYTPPDPEPTPAADLWAVAMTVLHAAEGEAPPRGPGASGSPRSVNASELVEILEPATAADPARRPDAATLVHDLHARFRPRRARRVGIPALAAAAALLVAATITVTLRTGVGVVEPDRPPRDFTAIPRPCGLLTPDQVSLLIPGTARYSKGEPDSCTWDPWDSTDLPGVLRTRLVLRLGLEDDPDEALDDEIDSRSEVVGPVKGIGDEAYLFRDTLTTGGLSVFFRTRNLLVQVAMERASGGGEMQNAVERAARWVAEALIHV